MVASNKKQLVAATDKFGLSALHYATLHGFRDVAEVLAHDLKVGEKACPQGQPATYLT